jgi:chemotaxis protein MotA
MVGTLVGMVIMLQHLQADMSNVGTGLAIALLATLYGIITARLFYLPAADKLMQKEEIMRFRNYMMTEGLVLLAEKQSPRYMQDKLNSFLDPAIHFNLDTQLKSQSQGNSYNNSSTESSGANKVAMTASTSAVGTPAKAPAVPAAKNL